MFDWTDFSQFMIWRQFAPEHSLECDVENDFMIHSEKFFFITNSKDTKNFFEHKPEHRYKCFINTPDIYVIFPHRVVDFLHHGYVYTRLLRTINNWSLFRGYLNIRTCPSKRFLDYGYLLRFLKYDNMYVSLYNTWSEERGFGGMLETKENENKKISNLKGSILYDTSTTYSCSVTYPSLEKTPGEWLSLHDGVDAYKFLSFRTFCKSQSRKETVWLSPFFSNFIHNPVKVGILVSNNCKKGVESIIDMCNFKNRYEIRSQQANTMIIVQDITARALWDRCILKNCKVRGEIRKVCHANNDTSLYQILSSRFVIVQASTFRSNVFDLLNSVEWYRIVVDGCITYNSNTAQRILQLRCNRRWCITFPGEIRIMDIFGIIGMWTVVPKPSFENSFELKMLKRLFTFEIITDVPPVHIHFVDISQKTLKKVNHFCYKICVSNCYKAKYIGPILEVLSSGEDVYESKIWDIMYTDKIWPEYDYLPIATETHLTNDLPQCRVCYSSVENAIIQTQCRHLLCIRCTQLLRDCPHCDEEICYIYQPNSDVNSHLSNSLHSDSILCNRKNVYMIEVLEKLLQQSHRRIVIVNGLNLSLDQYMVTLDIKIFETDNRYRILLIPRCDLKNVHFTTVTDLFVGFSPKVDERICDCSETLNIHVFLFRNTIEEYMHKNDVSPKNKKFWDDFKCFIENQ